MLRPVTPSDANRSVRRGTARWLSADGYDPDTTHGTIVLSTIASTSARRQALTLVDCRGVLLLSIEGAEADDLPPLAGAPFHVVSPALLMATGPLPTEWANRLRDYAAQRVVLRATHAAGVAQWVADSLAQRRGIGEEPLAGGGQARLVQVSPPGEPPAGYELRGRVLDFLAGDLEAIHRLEKLAEAPVRTHEAYATVDLAVALRNHFDRQLAGLRANVQARIQDRPTAELRALDHYLKDRGVEASPIAESRDAGLILAGREAAQAQAEWLREHPLEAAIAASARAATQGGRVDATGHSRAGNGGGSQSLATAQAFEATGAGRN